MITVMEISVWAKPELGVDPAGQLLDREGLSGEWGCAHVVRQGDDGESRWTMLSRDVELFRSFRATAIDSREMPDALVNALTPELFDWTVPGWPDEWPTLWPHLKSQGIPTKIKLVEEGASDA